jgi:hypothetical protein
MVITLVRNVAFAVCHVCLSICLKVYVHIHTCSVSGNVNLRASVVYTIKVQQCLWEIILKLVFRFEFSTFNTENAEVAIY